MAFKIAGSIGFKAAIEKAQPVLLEPIMAVEVTVPEEYVGDIIGDMNSRRGRVLGTDPRGHYSVISVEAPLAEMLSYAPDLTSMTGGRGDYRWSSCATKRCRRTSRRKSSSGPPRSARRRQGLSRAQRGGPPPAARRPRRIRLDIVRGDSFSCYLLRFLEAAAVVADERAVESIQQQRRFPVSKGEIGTMRVKSGLADMLKGGVIMDVTNAEQAKIAEEAGAVRGHGARAGAGRHPRARRRRPHGRPAQDQGDPGDVSIPVMAKARIGHFVEAQVLEALEVDYIDESEVLTPADEANHIDKWKFNVPFVCGAIDLGQALRRINEGAAMIRTKGEAGTGDVVEAVRHMRTIMGDIRRLRALDEDELYNVAAKELRRPYELVAGWPRTASSRSSTSPPVASPRLPTRR